MKRIWAIVEVRGGEVRGLSRGEDGLLGGRCRLVLTREVGREVRMLELRHAWCAPVPAGRGWEARRVDPGAILKRQIKSKHYIKENGTFCLETHVNQCCHSVIS